MPRSRFRLFRLIFHVLVLASLAGALALGIFWQKGILQSWLQAELLEAYLRKVAPHLPFQIEKIEIRKSWREILKGRIASLDLVLRWGEFRIRLDGPVDFGRASGTPNHSDFELAYSPESTIEPVVMKNPAADRSSAVSVRLFGKVGTDFSHVHTFGLEAGAGRFIWKFYGIDSSGIKIRASWNEGGLRAEAQVGSFNYTTALPDQALSIEGFQVQARTSLQLQPFQTGPEMTADFHLQGGELLWGKAYATLPWTPLKWRAQFFLDTKRLVVSFGSKVRGAEIEALFPKRLVSWKTSPLMLRKIQQTLEVASASAFGPLPGLEIQKGEIESRGRVILPEKGSPHMEGELRIRGADLKFPKALLLLKGIEADLPFSTRSTTLGTLEVQQALFRHFKGTLGKTRVILAPGFHPSHLWQGHSWSIVEPELPLKVEQIPLKLAATRGTLGPKGLELHSSLKITSLPLEKITQRLCLNLKRAPPVTLSADLQEVEWADDAVDITGSARAELFNGFVEVEEMGIFDISSPVPEIDFDLDLGKIRLDLLGDWLGFGEMDGVLQGYARDVTFQSWLPTHYDFKVEAKPYHRSKVVFSPDAMKNLVRIFAGDATDSLPGVADWLAFGWPSRVFGGYDVLYAGFSLFSNEGEILLKTLDPEDVLKRTRNHFFLYGPRFKMPLHSSNYPLVLDATAMGNFVRHMIIQLKGMAERKAALQEKKKDEDSEPEKPCFPEGF